MNFTERRKVARHTLDASLRLLPDTETQVFECRPLDVSQRGLGIMGDRALERETICMVSFDLFCRGEQRRINARGKVVATIQVHPGTYRIGISFIDMDSRSRQLLECLGRHSCRGSGCGVVHSTMAEMACYSDVDC